VAIDPPTGAVAGSLGIVVTGGRGRYQAVDTAEAFRRRGIASRLVVEAAQRAAADHGAERFAIVADRTYHALGLYESLGFERAEHVLGVCRWPRVGLPTSGPGGLQGGATLDDSARLREPMEEDP